MTSTVGVGNGLLPGRSWSRIPPGLRLGVDRPGTHDVTSEAGFVMIWVRMDDSPSELEAGRDVWLPVVRSVMAHFPPGFTTRKVVTELRAQGVVSVGCSMTPRGR